MISNIEKSGIGLELDSDFKKYLDKKIGKLDRYVPRSARKSLFAVVKVRDTGGKSGDKYSCEVILHLPGKEIIAKESTLNMFAAADIVEAKLKNQLKKYKDEYTKQARADRGKILTRLKQRFLKSKTKNN